MNARHLASLACFLMGGAASELIAPDAMAACDPALPEDLSTPEDDDCDGLTVLRQSSTRR